MIHEIAPRKYQVAYQNRIAGEEDFYIGFQNGCILTKVGSEIAFPTVSEARKKFQIPEEEKFTYLFSIDDMKFFGTLDFTPEEAEGFKYIHGNDFRMAKPRYLAFVGMLSQQFLGWYERSRFCGRCGEKTEHSEKERMMHCKKCGNMIFPQICPCVIVGVRNGDKLLVTRYNPDHKMVCNGRTFKPTVKYSLVAGYIETGETAEDCVRREVMEEVGLQVKNIQFYKSAPWPATGSLLLGYFCDVDGDTEIKKEQDELSEAVWISRSEMEDRSDNPSLTSDVMDAFRTGKY